ncbi:hypothetical protein YC2023_074347 [Brassica napus]
MDELQPRDREGLTSVLEELQPLDSLMSGRTEEVYLFSLCLMSDYDRDEGEKDDEAGNESEFDYEENTKSGKRDNIDEVEGTWGLYLFDIEESVVVFQSSLRRLSISLEVEAPPPWNPTWTYLASLHRIPLSSEQVFGRTQSCSSRQLPTLMTTATPLNEEKVDDK